MRLSIRRVISRRRSVQPSRSGCVPRHPADRHDRRAVSVLHEYRDPARLEHEPRVKWEVPLGSDDAVCRGSVRPILASGKAMRSTPGSRRRDQWLPRRVENSEFRARRNWLAVSGESELEYDDRETVLSAPRSPQARTVGRNLVVPVPICPDATDDVRHLSRGVARPLRLRNFRDSDSVKVLPGFELKPFALIAGTVFVGYRQFNPLDRRVPDYRRRRRRGQSQVHVFGDPLRGERRSRYRVFVRGDAALLRAPRLRSDGHPAHHPSMGSRRSGSTAATGVSQHWTGPSPSASLGSCSRRGTIASIAGEPTVVASAID